MENNTHYAPLPITFKKGVFNYRQLSRNDIAAIYEQLHDGVTVGFEVYLIRTQEMESKILFGKVVLFEAKEILPGTEQWGTYAWTCRSKTEAEQKVRILQQKQIEAKDGATV